MKNTMKFKILTLFPEMFPGPIDYSITGKALKKKNFS
jgi:tRNA G37 N-methylase TrmD